MCSEHVHGPGCLLLFSRSVMSSCFTTQWTVAHQAPLSMGFSRQEYWSGLPCPAGSGRSHGTNLSLLHWQGHSLSLSHHGSPHMNLQLGKIIYHKAYFIIKCWLVHVIYWLLHLEKGMATHSSILPGDFHGRRSLVGCSPWGCTELDATMQPSMYTSTLNVKTRMAVWVLMVLSVFGLCSCDQMADWSCGSLAAQHHKRVSYCTWLATPPKKPKYKVLSMVSTERLSLLHHYKAKKLLSQRILSQDLKPYNLKRRHLGGRSPPTDSVSAH